MSTVLEMGSQEKTHAPVAAYIAMTAGTNTVSWINMAGVSSKVEALPTVALPTVQRASYLQRSVAQTVRAACKFL